MRIAAALAATGLSLSLYAAAPAGEVALGLGATDSSLIVVRIDGKETTVKLAGVTAGSERGAAFLKCLVAGRVVRVKGPHTGATVTLLDDTSVAAHVEEFLQTTTSSDPCAIGKAAYHAQPMRLPAAASKPPAKPQAQKVPERVIHVSVSSQPSEPPSLGVAPLGPAGRPQDYGPGYEAPPPAPAPENQPTIYSPPHVTSYQAPQVGTQSPESQAVPAQQNLGQGQTQAPQTYGPQPVPQQGPQPVPSTTYQNPPPPQ